jgi:hypothetical protein
VVTPATAAAATAAAAAAAVTISAPPGGGDDGAAAAAGGPTPISLARALGTAEPGSSAALVLEAAEPWTTDTQPLEAH